MYVLRLKKILAQKRGKKLVPGFGFLKNRNLTGTEHETYIKEKFAVE